MSELTVDECKRIMSAGRKQLSVARKRIDELESLVRGFHHCAQQGKCANCEHFRGNDGCGLSLWERYDALGADAEGGA